MPTSAPDVSVIVPVYNRAEYLPASVDSILQQRWPGSLEILCVDDGSEVDPFAALPAHLPPQVHLLRKEHGGVGAARQHALERARGRLIAFNDDDDLWLPDALSVKTAALQEHPELDMVFSDLREFSGTGDPPRTRDCLRGELRQVPRRKLHGAGVPLYRFEPDSLLGAFMSGAAMFFQTVLARREFLSRIGDMDSRTRSCGDCLDFSVRASHGGVLGFLDVPTFDLRRGHAHMTATHDWLEREMKEFLGIYPTYPDHLQRALAPWLARYLSYQGWLHFRHHEYSAAAAAYRRAAAHGPLATGARLRWLMASCWAPFEDGLPT